MRSRSAALTALILSASLAIGGCGSPAAPDAYDLLTATTEAAWDPIQINIGLTAKDGDTTFTIDPTAIALVAAGGGTKTAVHIALPAASLGLEPSMLDALGFDGDAITFDVLYDGAKLYARSAMLGTTLRMILGPSGNVPSGNLAGWLAFGSAEEFAALSNLVGGSGPIGPGAASPPGGSPAPLKAALGDLGITLSNAGTEQHGGIAAIHLAIAIDTQKLLASPLFDAATKAQLGQLGVSLGALTLSGDLWIDPAANRVVEMDLHVGSSTEPDQAADVTVTVRDPDGSVSLEAPSAFVDVPIGTLVREMLKLLGRGAES